MGKDQELLEAARNGNIQTVEKILSQRAKRSGPLASLRRGPGANIQDNSGYSCLHHAALNGHKEIVRLLLSHEASTNIVDVKGSSPLHLAAWSGNEEIVKLLLCHGPSVPNVNLTTNDNETALHCAAQYGHSNVVAFLLEYGCDPTIRNNRDETALDLAAQYGRLETVELLLKTYPILIETMRRPDQRIRFSHTPLHLASRNGHKSVVEVLLNAGIDVNIRTSNGTALHESALCGKLEVVRTLLDHGVDYTIRDSHRNTVMDLLRQFPPHVTRDIVKIIQEYGCTSIPQNCDSDTDDRESVSQFLPPIPVPNLGSPYENVRLSSHSLKSCSKSANTSPRQQDFYRHSKSLDDSLDGNFVRTTTLPTFADHQSPYYGESDLISISSENSSVEGRHSRDRHEYACELNVPKNRGHNSVYYDSVSPTPPKKPPRRNLSVSPTHLTSMSTSMDGSSDMNSSTYLSARSGTQSQDELEIVGGHRNDKHSRHSNLRSAGKRIRENDKFFHYEQNKHIFQEDNKKEPVAISSMYENVTIKTQNPRRKLRRHHNNNADDKNDDAPHIPFHEIFMKSNNFDNNNKTQIIYSSNNYDSYSNMNMSTFKVKPVQRTPLSPTNYRQPPTPDHPPPSPIEAENSIYQHICPLSQEYKRRSRDIETEIDDDFLILAASYNSSGSYSSSISLSDRSVSGDNNIEEYVSDIPFAGLLKGSTTKDDLALLRSISNEKCGTYFQHDGENCKHLLTSRNSNYSASSGFTSNGLNKSVSFLDSFNEQEEWAKIYDILASIGSGIPYKKLPPTEMEREFESAIDSKFPKNHRSLIMTPVGLWLDITGYPQYETLFLENGYDDSDFLNGVLDEHGLEEIGISEKTERQCILDSVKTLPNKILQCCTEYNNNDNETTTSVEEWLRKINLDMYIETFNKHFYTDMDKINGVWEIELKTILEVNKLGHRKRILRSLSSSDSKSSFTEESIILKIEEHVPVVQPTPPPPVPVITSVGIGSETLKRNRKKNRPAPLPPVCKKDLELRTPNDLLVGTPKILKTDWKHQTNTLESESVTYIANYLGSTIVKELKGTESTKKSLKKIKMSSKDKCSILQIILAISHYGVKYLNIISKEPVCEHQIRNIHCAYQDADDLTHFAYITKDHSSENYYCHVFSVSSMDQATDIILTLGQAFEVAYQIVMRDHAPSQKGHIRSHSVNHLTNEPLTEAQQSTSPMPIISHGRSHSVNEIKFNTHQLTITAISMSNEDLKIAGNNQTE